jgi:hypothetical protein
MMKTHEVRTHPPAPERDPAAGTDPRPRYEPPRIQKKRSLSRATLFTGQGPEGPSTAGPGLVGEG